MQQRSKSSTPHPAVAGLVAEMGRILERLAEVGPSDIVTVPLVLPLEVAELMAHQAETMGLDMVHIHVSCLLHGQYHAALEAGAPASAQHLAAMIRRLAPPQEWEWFLAQHPEAREGL